MYAGMTLVCQCKQGGLSLWYGCSIGWSHGQDVMNNPTWPSLAICTLQLMQIDIVYTRGLLNDHFKSNFLILADELVI